MANRGTSALEARAEGRTARAPKAETVDRRASEESDGEDSWESVDLGQSLRERLVTHDRRLMEEVERRLNRVGLGAEFKEWRKQHSLNQADAARLAGVSQSQVSRIESGNIGAVEMRTVMR